MAVPSTFADLSTTPGSNSGLISDSTAVNQIDNHLQSVYALIASIYANSGNGWASPYLTTANPVYTGNLTGGTGVVNLGSGQVYKDASGNVGIGTTSTAVSRLSVLGTDAINSVRFRAATGMLRFSPYQDATEGSIISSANAAESANIPLTLSASAHRFTLGTAEAARIDGSGNVGIGTASPGALLHVAGSVRLDAATTTSATAGGASALPALPAGYLTVNIGGTDYKLPYFAA